LLLAPHAVTTPTLLGRWSGKVVGLVGIGSAANTLDSPSRLKKAIPSNKRVLIFMFSNDAF
jgi:ammonia channel protein AmtB